MKFTNKLTKKQIKTYDLRSLIVLYNDTQYRIQKIFASTTGILDFNFLDYYKKLDTKKMRDIKYFISLVDTLYLILQEFRSKGFSLIEISDFEKEPFFMLRKSFKEKKNDN